MSHQVIITFDMDEDMIQEHAEKEAGRQIARNVIDTVFGNGYDRQSRINAAVSKAIKEILEPKKDEIISEAIKEVVGTLGRTKAVRERMEQALMEDDGK